ncbi:MAG: pyridoxamine 5-phosphate oxidase-related, FMN-binding protein [Myxococcaceae bacterium]|nr:pyridoxamine 5-phosphate oxidase-related, FMN-binding protein [Myxococcaceae bacterium]
MNLRENWPQIRSTFESSLHSSLHCAIATIRDDGYPHVTPIGHIFLRDDQTAFYFEEHARRLPENLQHNPRVCLLFVNSKRWFWARALFRGRFVSPPGMRLLGVAGDRREATNAELAAYEARVKSFKRLKGYSLIWKDLRHVRDIKLEHCEPIVYPYMTDGLWT